MSWLRGGTGYDLFFNRDEKRARKPAEPPEERRVGSVRVLAPRDGEAGGSWISVNEHGLTLALLNGYRPADAATAPACGRWTSRGELVMDLSDSRSAAAVEQRLRSRDLASFRSFHLAAIDAGSARLASWIDRRLECVDDFSAPLISSSFEYEPVAESRRRIYHELIDEVRDAKVEAALAYHRNHRPERGPFSACMHRADARTVSFTWVSVGAERVSMRYCPDSPCRGWPPSEPRTLALAGR